MALKHMMSADMIIETKQMICFGHSIWGKGTTLFWKSGRGTAAHLHLKIHTQNNVFLFSLKIGIFKTV